MYGLSIFDGSKRYQIPQSRVFVVVRCTPVGQVLAIDWKIDNQVLRSVATGHVGLPAFSPTDSVRAVE